MIKVAIFEDNAHLRATCQLLLEAADDIVCVGAWPDANQAVANLGGTECDVVLMDIEMPGTNGIEATAKIKEHLPNINVVIQSVFDDDDYIFRAICNGASGYLLKNIGPERYLDVIREVHSGGSPMTPGIARRVLELFKSGYQPGSAASPRYNLTEQETKVLGLLVAGKSYKMIADSLIVSLQTVKSHIRNIYAKLHVHSSTEAVSKAIRDRIVRL